MTLKIALIKGSLLLAAAAGSIVISTPEPALATSAPAVEAEVLGWQHDFAPGEVTDIPKMSCPANTPYLIHSDYSPGRANTPPGVEVIENHLGVLTALPTEWTDSYWKYVTGVGGRAPAIDWALNTDAFGKRSVSIYLHCTSDTLKAYPNAIVG